MLKGLFFCLPSASVINTLTPVIDRLATKYTVIYYNSRDCLPPGDTNFYTASYPDSFNGYYSESIDEKTSYFDFARILMDSAESLLGFLMNEIQREKPDFIIHSHLAVWGKLLAKHFEIPSITFFTTFVLDKRIMLPFFRGLNKVGASAAANVQDAIIFRKRVAALYSGLNLPDDSDLWDIYINKGCLNISFVYECFQPQRAILDRTFHFVGNLTPLQVDIEWKFIYISMGTVLSKDVPFYRYFIRAFKNFPYRVIISVGAKISASDFTDLPENIEVVAYADQRSLLKKAALFVTHGGMMSVNEAIHSLTPMLVIPIIPEQHITAGNIVRLELGRTLKMSDLSENSLKDAAKEILHNRNKYVRNIADLVNNSGKSAMQNSIDLIRNFL